MTYRRRNDIYGTNKVDDLQGRIFSDDFVFGFGGDDTLQDDMSPSTTIPDSNDVYFGGYGNDHIDSTDGSDQLYGGFGDDELCVWRHPGKILVAGGKGVDDLTLWDFDANKADVREFRNHTVVEQGHSKVVILDNVETWIFF